MKLLYITTDATPWRSELAEAISRCGIDCTHSQASSLIVSIFSLVALLKRSKPDAVMANTPELLLSCTLARKLASLPSLPIIALIDANAKRPKGIVSDLRQNVALWIFPSQQHADAFPADLLAKAVAPLAEFASADALGHADGQTSAAPAYLWLGPIDEETQERLRESITRLNSEPAASLTICGQGKARYTMPAVNDSRNISNPERVTWTGQPVTAAELPTLIGNLGNAQVLRSSFDPTPLELAAEWIINPNANPSPMQRVETLSSLISSAL